jgi:ComF family protein
MREAWLRLVTRALSAALLTEARCPGCGRAESGLGGGLGGLCPQCRAASATALGTAEKGAPCPGCGEYPIAPQAQPILCGQCRMKPRPWGRLLAYGPYEGQLRDTILAYKFQQRLDLGRWLMECALAAFERGEAAFSESTACEGIVPVPLHGRRLMRRGFNQSREIARLLSARRKLPIWQDALIRVRRTVPQMTLAREVRAENIRGAFLADEKVLSGRTVLLVDDIMTTGATLEECTRTMLRAGASRVDVLVLARA